MPSQLWGSLEPTDLGLLPANRDTTDFDGVGSFETNPYWLSLDVEQGWVFTATSTRVQIWDVRSTPGSPSFMWDRGINSSGLTWAADAHAFSVFEDIDAPPGKSDRMALVGRYGVGIAIYDTTDKMSPAIKYQDNGPGTTPSRNAKGVYATTIGGVDYAFIAADVSGGVYAYNMTVAKNLSSRCTERQPGTTVCPGVYLGKIGTRSTASFIDGAGNFIVFSSKFSPKGFEIWNVSNPSAPVQVMNALSTDSVYGVALWQDGSSYYLALRTPGSTGQGRIYNVSCITNGFCSLGSPIWTKSMPTNGDPQVTDSAGTGGVPFVYFGDSNYCLSGNQNEWLYNVTNPASPVDLTPPGTVILDGEAVSYWGWYYRQNGVHGFNRVAPRVGKFYGDYFYRAAHGIFDVHHQTTGSPPVAAFSWTPAQIYPDTPVSFIDQSTGGGVMSWSWDFLPDGNPSSSTAQNPSGVTFDSAGTKTVSLEVANISGSDSTSRSVTVLPPEAMVTSVSATPNPALVCQPVTFTAQGATGQPPLSFSWQIRQVGGGVVDTGGNVNPFVWTSAPGTTVGVGYTAQVTVSNGSGSDSATSASVTLNGLPALPSSGGFVPTYDGQPAPPASGTVVFHAGVAGATEWNWNFGDDPGGGPNNDGYQGWTNDPVSGPNPTHTYAVAAIYDVQVKVRNCLEAERESSVLSVDVSNAQPLVADFLASLFCGGGVCFADAGVAITFTDRSEGNPDLWDYDWDGDGSFEDPDHASPVTSHTYQDVGVYHPRVRVRRTSASDVYEDHPLINVGSVAAPTITITGSSSVAAGHAIAFTASSSGCTPLANGWSWSTAGGAGSSATSEVVVAWSAAGGKTLEATNSACAGATGTKSVTVTGSTSGLMDDGFESGDTSNWTTAVSDGN
ncbi:MAG: PKD domain-containing protein [Acidobacteria bacterium]|nr:PKD domain-containing protein [Acidobacteriota bacterium]